MSIEAKCFERYRPVPGRLEGAGFKKAETVKTGMPETEMSEYRYEEDFLNGQFRAELRLRFVAGRTEPAGDSRTVGAVDKDGIGGMAGTAESPGIDDSRERWQITGRVIDLDTEEEYLPIRARYQVGGFVGSVREAYMQVLERVREACFVPVDFLYDQANRIRNRIVAEYGDEPEFPWEKYPGNGTFKCPENGKWYGIIMPVAFGKLRKPADAEQSRADGGDRNVDPVDAGDSYEKKIHAYNQEDIVEVINLKAESDEIPDLTKKAGIYQAWHMNKTHWISVLLDDTLSDEQVMQLIDASHALVAGQKSAGYVTGNAWIIPSNPKIYDIDAGFSRGGGVIEWHQHNNIKPGDEVYIYSSAPNSAILYRTVVEASDLQYQGMFRDKEGYVRSMRIRLAEKYPKDRYPLSFMREHGGSPVRSARRMPEELLKAMREEE